jgi:chromosome segregation ATPase
MMEPPPAANKSKKRKRREKPQKKRTRKRIAALLTEGLAEHKEACRADLAAKDEAIAAQESDLAELKQGLAALDEHNRRKRSKTIAKASERLARMQQAKRWVQKELDELLATTINETSYRLHYHKALERELGLLGRDNDRSFGPQRDAVERVLGGIREARRSLTGVVSSLTNMEVAKALVDAQDTNGVAIYILAERRRVCSCERRSIC